MGCINMSEYKTRKDTNKKILRVTVDITVNLPKDKTIEDIKSGLVLYPDDIVDGFIISTDIKGYDNKKDFFLKEAHFNDIEIIQNGEEKELCEIIN